MKLDGDLPAPILAKLLALEETAEHLADQVHRASDNISASRARLQNGAAGMAQREHDDLLVATRKAIEDFPQLQAKSNNAQRVVRSCKDWIASLPENTELALHEVHVDGHTVASVRNRIRDLKDELERLGKVPTPSPDIERRVRDYVKSLTRPKVTGITLGETLKVSFPDDTGALIAFLDADALIQAIRAEVYRMANNPMSPVQREERMAALSDEVTELLYLEEKLIAGATEYVERHDAPPWAILCAAIVRDDADTKVEKVERRRASVR
jgi:hypothetical protein